MTTVKEIIGAMLTPSPEDTAFIEKAYTCSEKAHASNTRFSGEPYFIHPSAVAKILAEYGMDSTTIAAGLLHDAVEDGGITREEVEKEFKQATGEIDWWLTETAIKSRDFLTSIPHRLKRKLGRKNV